MTDEVHDIAAAIARLAPAQKRRLFELLAARGDLPPAAPEASRSPAQLNLIPAGEPRQERPDYLLIFDGGSKGNPGPGYGSYAITRLRDGARRLERLDLGEGYTSNEAEYDVLIAALEDLIARIEDAGRKPEEFSLEVRGDSALVINQVEGRWKASEPRMRQRRDQCRRLLSRFGAVVLKAHPREESVRVLGH
ncbi:MAG: ribonuclease HI family protein [Anaerolineae bacterium]|nr:ribonuclease HI family protein [Anaerolineae bacterium]